MLDTIEAEVRVAGPADEDDLIKLCRARHAEEHLRALEAKPFPFSEEATRRTLHRALVAGHNDPNISSAWCGVIGAAGHPIMGSVFLSVQTPFDSDQPYLSEMWNWVYPQYRKSDIPSKLFAFSQTKAEEFRMFLIGSVIADEAESPKMRFFKRKGCQNLGSMYVYDAQTGV